jgi:hypothetical protein
MGVCGLEDVGTVTRIHGHAVAIAALLRVASQSAEGFPESQQDIILSLAIRMLTDNRHRTAITRLSVGTGL